MGPVDVSANRPVLYFSYSGSGGHYSMSTFVVLKDAKIRHHTGTFIPSFKADLALNRHLGTSRKCKIAAQSEMS